MTSEPMPRRLAAILAADVAGYTRLMEADEAATVAAWRQSREQVIDPTVAAHQGRIVKLTGDGFLAEFPTVESAVRCALAMQEAFGRLFGAQPEARRVAFRMGVELGDIYVDQDDIYGGGVNVAARLESLAEPGGICISGAVHDQIKHKVEARLEDIGLQQVKNITRPIQVYRLHGPAAAQPRAPTAPVPADAARLSIAVLPFANLSGDAEQEYFADGLTEDIITELSRFHELFVISRNSTFTYKGRSVKVQEVARELGVAYVVEGSVRKAGSRVRVTVQLIDAESDRHVWADRYDRDLEDIFAIQDEVTAAIASTLPGRMEAASRERARRKHTDNLAAYECVLAGKVHHHRSTPADNVEALRLLERAIALDPDYAHAHAWRACVLGQAWRKGWCEDVDAAWRTVLEELRVALALDDSDSDVHRILAAVNITRNDLDQAAYHQEKGLSLNPNYDLIVVQQGELLTWLGEAGEGIEWIRKAMRLNPYHPPRFWSHLGRACYGARRYDEAIDAFRRIATPDYSHHAFLAACHARSGEAAGASSNAAEVQRLEPGCTVESFLRSLHYRHERDRAHLREALIDAGLPA